MGANATILELLVHVFIALLFLLFMITAAIGENAITIRCFERERNALLQLKEGLVDDFNRLSSWSGENCCKWQGLGCSNLTGHVLTLDLHPPGYDPYNNDLYRPLSLRGKLVFSSLVELHHLTYLDLSANRFNGSQIPEFIGSLRELRYLNLSQSFFTGTIPFHQIGNLTHLQTLDLGYNEFESFKNLEWLSNLRAIRYLDLSFIDLSNTNWLQQIQKLPLLTELHLSGCDIRSPLPPLTNSSYMPLLAVIDLSENDFRSSSQTFHWLYNLSSSLVDVDISYNVLKGPIPDVFWNMIYIQYLRLRMCWLEGIIPESFGNLTHLQSLDLAVNSLAGNLSEVLNKWSRGAKNSIEVLDLSHNELSGSLPDLTRFSSLKKFSVSDNKLNGPFPESFRQHLSLVTLDLSSNKLTCSLPNQLSFPNLKYLDLSNNTLKGRLTESIGKFAELLHMDISLNSFDDTITEVHFMKLSKLKVLDLSFNSLVLDVSSNWIPPFQLDVIALGSCQLGPHFPKWLQTQNKFSELHIPHANISDEVPNWFWNLSPRLTYLNLSSNQMTGVIPDLSSKFTGLYTLDLSSNQFNGPLPLIPPKVESLYLFKNRFVGSISSVCNIASIKNLDLSDNLLSGELPDCWKQFRDQFYILNLANNNFTGKIPSSIGFLTKLVTLYLGNNNFIGKLPSSLKDCRSLRLIDLGGNILSGRIPEWIGIYLTDLIILSLSQNKFYGSIPSNICNLNKIKVLDLSQNSISGYVPPCFNNFTSLIEMSELVEIPLLFHFTTSTKGQGTKTYSNHAVVQWKGQRTEYGKTLMLLKVIDLSSNKLTGEIPVELASLIDLRSLNLSSNCFTGRIPQKIGQMKMLESMDLSRNLLSGGIPVGLGSLTFLSVLDLSNNNLSGKIPSGTQLQGFNSTVYAGNHELCGLPLPKKCPGNGVTLVHPVSKDNNDEEDRDELITPGFYASLVLGFAVGFWGVFGMLQLKHTWRRALFQFLNDIKDRVYVAAAVNLARIKRMRRG